MTESQHLPRRIADLALTVPEDTARLADLIEAERAANARVVEAERVLSVARAEAEQATRERTGLEGDIQAVHALLEYGQRTYGFNVAPLLAPPVTPPVTPPQGTPSVRYAAPVEGPNGVHCFRCEGELVREDGTWLHTATGHELCDPPAGEGATQVLVPVQPVPAARDEQDGGES